MLNIVKSAKNAKNPKVSLHAYSAMTYVKHVMIAHVHMM